MSALIDDLFESIAAYQCRIKVLEHELAEFKNGARYIKLQQDHHRVIAGYQKRIRELEAELSRSHAREKSNTDIWFNECEAIWESTEREAKRQDAEIEKLRQAVFEAEREGDEALEQAKQRYEAEISEKETIIKELTAKLAHLEALAAHDSTNTNIPTSQTPPGKKKHIPNSRRNTGKKKGGQPGHEQHKMQTPSDNEIDDVIEHPIGDGECCPECGSDEFQYTGEYDDRYEVDVEIKVKRTRHRYYLYRCMGCGMLIRTEVEPNLRADCQYGAVIQAIALSLVNSANAAINKLPLFIEGITDGEIRPSEGYIAKLQPRAAKGLEVFQEDLYVLLITRTLVYWDDTVVMADKKRICLRFYGDEQIAYYVAHEKKDMIGILEDGVLEALEGTTRVMHDHNSINYNERFAFINIECNAHLQRDLQKIADDTGHTELLELKDLITETIKDRNDRQEQGIKAFDEQYIEAFDTQLEDILDRAEQTAAGNDSIYTGSTERAVIARVKEYRDNFFAWVRDFSIPVTNNLSERALRGIKTKMKVAGQFASVKTAGYYARIKSYTETCRRNGINEISALIRLCKGNPYTVAEIFSSSA